MRNNCNFFFFVFFFRYFINFPLVGISVRTKTVRLIEVLRKFGFLGVSRLFPGSTLVFFHDIFLTFPHNLFPPPFYVPLTSSPPSSLLYLCDTIGVCFSMPLWSSVNRNRNVYPLPFPVYSQRGNTRNKTPKLKYKEYLSPSSDPIKLNSNCTSFSFSILFSVMWEPESVV